MHAQLQSNYTAVSSWATTVLGTSWAHTASISSSPFLSLTFFSLPYFSLPVKPSFLLCDCCTLQGTPCAFSLFVWKCSFLVKVCTKHDHRSFTSLYLLSTYKVMKVAPICWFLVCVCVWSHFSLSRLWQKSSWLALCVRCNWLTAIISIKSAFGMAIPADVRI